MVIMTDLVMGWIWSYLAVGKWNVPLSSNGSLQTRIALLTMYWPRC
jgi:hypothetical protein